MYRGNRNAESQVVLEYKNKLGQNKSVEVAYITGLSKQVVDIEITSIDKNGNLVMDVKGFDGLGIYDKEDIK
ncbi:hypothetical protein ACKTJW_003148 [Clostridioides difficile]|uniref:hypothetical protein n=1 Tax=Clostridioides difficile TaxID=1496 RepID=UPI0003B28E69|nr:hypothetical protein [Clostridioides difficile]CCL55226.1 hypothetical protein BN180_2710001 [Clostridioides difficile E14]HBG3855158.1 hypothetical protein [Clostridioides difficile]HBG4348042.1 hypothetical protein [Clostridioides difficile]HBL8524151.1 hypothetical protein [Clostridioides difficile]